MLEALNFDLMSKVGIYMQNRANVIGLGAVFLWSLLALFTTYNNYIPAFQLLAMVFFISSSIGAVFILLTKQSFGMFFRFKWHVWLLGVYGLFGYHLCYFLALRFAPPIESNMINALWPLLIVLGSVLVVKKQHADDGLKWWHIIGALIGFAGVVNVSLARGLSDFNMQHLMGYGFALLAALIWSSYSLLSRKLPDIPTAAVTGFCFITAILALICHFLFEVTIWPSDSFAWLMLVLLGLGPVGVCFYLWDYGMKKGDIRALGAASYLAPIFATIFLALAGFGQLTLTVIISALMVVGGAVLASKDMFVKK